MPRPGLARRGGLIPARAGNTHHPVAPKPKRRAHPRSRGEHAGGGPGDSGSAGSSPLARGTLQELQPGEKTEGLIPARAGNTGDLHAWTAPAWAHPRSRGEHSLPSRSRPCESGSSPLARGTRYPKSSNFTITVAHPRSRGEHTVLLVKAAQEAGSSPLARGTPEPVTLIVCRPGLIPARAGNTIRKQFQHHGGRAHPRSRGEHVVFKAILPIVSGSSPLARGTPLFLVSDTATGGLIPARAGNTSP